MRGPSLAPADGLSHWLEGTTETFSVRVGWEWIEVAAQARLSDKTDSGEENRYSRQLGAPRCSNPGQPESIDTRALQIDGRAALERLALDGDSRTRGRVADRQVCEVGVGYAEAKGASTLAQQRAANKATTAGRQAWSLGWAVRKRGRSAWVWWSVFLQRPMWLGIAAGAPAAARPRHQTDASGEGPAGSEPERWGNHVLGL